MKSRIDYSLLIPAAPLLLATGLYGLYIVSHSYPVGIGGLFNQMIAEVSNNEFSYPNRISYYTENGIPFVYPPLGLYVLAGLYEFTKIDPLIATLIIPGFVLVVAAGILYQLAKELLHSRTQAMLTSILFVSQPAVIFYYMGATGLVHAPSLVLLLLGTITGLRLFRSSGDGTAAASTVLFGLTILSHPTHTLYFVLNYLALYTYFDRTVRGLVKGVVVGVGGIGLSAPWWVSVSINHGSDVFINAIGTHGGIGAFQTAIREILLVGGRTTPFLPVTEVIAVLGAAYLLVRRRFLLPTWAGLVLLVHPQTWYLALFESLIAATFLGEFSGQLSDIDGLATLGQLSDIDGLAVIVVAGIVAGFAVMTGVAYLTGPIHGADFAADQYVDKETENATRWLRRNTSPDASIFLIGWDTEWVPYLAERTALNTPWGAEWESTADFQRYSRAQRRLVNCLDIGCIDKRVSASATTVEYIYISTDTMHQTVTGLRSSIKRSKDYAIRFESDTILILEYRDDVSR